MEVENLFYLQPATPKARQKEEAAAALMDLASLPVEELKKPQCAEDLMKMGIQLRRMGSELIVHRDGDFKVVMLMSMEKTTVDGFRARAAAGSSFSEALSEVMKLTKFKGEERMQVQFVCREELLNLLKKASKFGPPIIGMPVSWTPGVRGLHLPGCSYSKHQDK